MMNQALLFAGYKPLKGFRIDAHTRLNKLLGQHGYQLGHDIVVDRVIYPMEGKQITNYAFNRVLTELKPTEAVPVAAKYLAEGPNAIGPGKGNGNIWYTVLKNQRYIQPLLPDTRHP